MDTIVSKTLITPSVRFIPLRYKPLLNILIKNKKKFLSNNIFEDVIKNEGEIL